MNKRPGAEATFDNKLGLTIAEAGLAGPHWVVRVEC